MKRVLIKRSLCYLIIAVSLLTGCSKDNEMKLENEVESLKKELAIQLNKIDEQDQLIKEKDESNQELLIKYNELINDLEADGSYDELKKHNDELSKKVDEQIVLIQELTHKLDQMKIDYDALEESIAYVGNYSAELFTDLVDYMLYEEDNEALSQKDLMNLDERFVYGTTYKILHGEFSEFSLDLNQENEIYYKEDGSFKDELEYLLLVIEEGILTKEDFISYFNQWFTIDKSREIVNDMCGTLENPKRFIEYENRLFTYGMGMGGGPDLIRPSLIRSRILQMDEEHLHIEFYYPNFYDDIEPQFYMQKETHIFKFENNQWKYFSKL